jgi:predicted Zn finger-like uncharacterized protein
MIIRTSCPSCGQRFKLADRLAGKRIRCPKCQETFPVPEPEDQQCGPTEVRPVPLGQPPPMATLLEDENQDRQPSDRADRSGAPRRRRRRRKASHADNRILLLCLGLGAGFFVLITGISGAGLWFYLKTPEIARTLDPKLAPQIQVINEDPFKPRVLSRYTASGKGFSFVPPAEFMALFGGPGGGFANFHEVPRNPHARREEPFVPNVNVHMDHHDGTPIENAGGEIMAVMEKQFKNWQMTDEALLTINGKRAYSIASRFEGEVNGQIAEIHLLQYVIIGTKNNVYVLTFAAGQKRFPTLRAGFEKSAHSVEVD